jgi:hypothetical protein
MAKESEKAIESFCVKEARDRGGKAFKFSSPSQRAVPDRIICLPGGVFGFLELKSEGKKPSKHQQYILDLLSDLGFKAGWADTKAKTKAFIQELMEV